MKASSRNYKNQMWFLQVQEMFDLWVWKQTYSVETVSGAFVKNIAESNAYRFIRKRLSVRQNSSALQRIFPVYTLMEILLSVGGMRRTAGNDVT